MVNQTIEQLLQEAVDQSLAQTQESRELAEEVSGKMADIDQKVVEAEQRTDVAIANVNAAIPDALSTGLSLILRLDVVNGDDTTADGTSQKPFKTLKALLDWAPVGAHISVSASSQTIDINEKITLIKKDVTFTVQNCVFNFNDAIALHNSKFKFYYSGNTINQNCAHVLHTFSSSFFMQATLNPGAGAEGFALTTIPHYQYISSPLTDGYFAGTISDAAEPYYIFDRKYSGTAYMANFSAITLGANCALFEPSLGSVQLGTKQAYLLGA